MSKDPKVPEEEMENKEATKVAGFSADDARKALAEIEAKGSITTNDLAKIKRLRTIVELDEANAKAEAEKANPPKK